MLRATTSHPPAVEGPWGLRFLPHPAVQQVLFIVRGHGKRELQALGSREDAKKAKFEMSEDAPP